MTIILLLGLLVGLIMLGAPIGFALAIVPTGYIIATEEVPWTMVPYTMYEALSFASLAAIPFFMLTGELMTSATITDHLIEFGRALVGWARGGLAQVNIVVSMFFAGLNGSVIADTATIGSILIPAMKRAGYSSAFSAAITSVIATIGGIIPPSVGMIILATVAFLPFDAVFTAGAVPGLLVGLTLMLITAIMLALLILIIGMIMDAAVNIIVIGPVLIEVSAKTGYPEVQAALVVLVGFLIGTVTPPIGVAYFTGSSIAKARLELVALEMIPFLLAEFAMLFLMMIVSPITMWLPRVFGLID